MDIEGEGQKRVYVTDVKDAEATLESYDIHPEIADVPQESVFMTTLLPVLLTGALVIFLFLMMNRQMSGGGGNAKMMNFGKSRARMMLPDDKKVTFQNVAGLQEEKEDLVEVVDFLKAPQKYTNVGARIPKGVILVGPPGTGKTLLAKAVAGEAGVPFFSISGSDFVEMFVGVGASRVRDLFEEGKKHAPCIIFIDEIDAVARQRGTGMGGGHDEREQTLNQLLVEMDGFGVNEGIIVMAATNRVDILDPAILRPGRFDRKVAVGRPDVKGREEILKVHAKDKPLGEDVNLAQIAQTTAGFTGADLENLLNEAAIMAARSGRSYITAAGYQACLYQGWYRSRETQQSHFRKRKEDHSLSRSRSCDSVSCASGYGIRYIRFPSFRQEWEQPDTPCRFRKMMRCSTQRARCFRILRHFLADVLPRKSSSVILRPVHHTISNSATSTARAMVMQYGMSDKLGLIYIW